jgi:hypothetical protein
MSHDLLKINYIIVEINQSTKIEIALFLKRPNYLTVERIGVKFEINIYVIIN